MSSVRFEQSDAQRLVQERSRSSLFHPLVDFFALGGLSLIALGGFALWGPKTEIAFWTTVAAMVAHVVNHPHFAASYQIFYARFGAKLRSAEYGHGLRMRYLFAGLIVPVLLLAFFIWCFITRDAQTLGFGVNAMFFLVGWHYVKQGYGVLMVYAALRKVRIPVLTRQVLLANAYACWGYAWLNANRAVYESEYWGVPWGAFALPEPYFMVLAGTAATLTLTASLLLIYDYYRDCAAPLNGLVGYACAIYPWTVVPHLHPAMALLIPAFHSLQYLIIVARFRINYGAGTSTGRAALPARLRGAVGFFVVSAALGYLGFWGLPEALSAVTAWDAAFGDGSRALFFCAWIFINVHHYFLDNVMWRRENPDIRRHLLKA
ncbi:MAG: hypothetical protein AAF458_23335 [Pseudomonadota bacterium]